MSGRVRWLVSKHTPRRACLLLLLVSSIAPALANEAALGVAPPKPGLIERDKDGPPLNRAAEQLETVGLETTEDLLSAFGLVIHEPERLTREPSQVNDFDLHSSAFEGLTQTAAAAQPSVHRRSAAVFRRDDSRWEIQVWLKPDDYQPGALLTVVAQTESGQIITGPVRLLNTLGQSVEAAQVDCPQQEVLNSVAALALLDKPSLEKEIQVSAKHQRILSKLLKTELSPAFIKKVEALEQKLGLFAHQPISTNLGEEELARRLGTILALLNE